VQPEQLELVQYFIEERDFPGEISEISLTEVA
jgi:hypothetical protein